MKNKKEFVEYAIRKAIKAKRPARKCLIWPFFRDNNGRAKIWPLKGSAVEQLVHRTVCTALHGKPPRAKPLALHSCGNGHLGCIEGTHLYWGNHKDNSRDMVAHGTTNTPHNQARGTRVPQAVLTDREVISIRKRSARGEKGYVLAAEFGVKKSTVSRIINRRSWTHLE
jgi:hypothetical protein